MNKSVFRFLIFVGIGSCAIVGTYVYKRIQEKRAQTLITDAGRLKGNIRIGVDNWIGYFPLCSPHMQKLMQGAGYLLECVDDQANYDSRFKELRKQKTQFAVATIDSYLLNARNHNYPGTIIMVIDESKGGDAIVAYKSKVPNLDKLKGAINIKVGFTPASPSEHLLRSVAVHFDIPFLAQKGDWQVETDGSSDALKKFQNQEIDVAVLWEPDVSKALEKSEVVKLLGTEDTQKLIVDILIVEKEFSKESPEAVKALLANYFRTLKFYQAQPEELKKDVKKNLGAPAAKVDAMLQGVRWANLFENVTHWFGLNPSDPAGEEGVINTLQATSRILMDTNAVKENPIPEGNPYGLQNSSFLETIFSQGLAGGFGGSSVARETSQSVSKTFTALSSKQWDRLIEVGTFRIRPITFQSGTAKLDSAGREQLEEVAQALNHYPNFRVVIRGHSGTQGNPKANKKLSTKRAKAIKEYLISQFSVVKNRLQAVGYGAERPLPRQPGESNRAYQYRLPRVELALVSEVY